MISPPRLLPHLLDVGQLAAILAAPDVRVVDVRWRLGDPKAGPAAFAQGHIPGAVFADIDRDLASAPGEGGRHPLPSAEAFASLMGRLGVGDTTRVVAYDDQGGATAARLWFLLRYFGHETGAVLDGGLSAYTQAGRPLETAVTTPPPASFHAIPRPELVLDRAAVAARVGQAGALLFDARAPERFRGEVEPIDPRAGHIPGAVNAPFAENLAGGAFLPPGDLATRYRALGAFDHDTAVYCGSGVTACHDLLALAVAGLPDAKLYAGSWSEWARAADAAVATGE
jgi:thiosulfate/3-mercaptopyruvate sulfurtransferase